MSKWFSSVFAGVYSIQNLVLFFGFDSKCEHLLLPFHSLIDVKWLLFRGFRASNRIRWMFDPSLLTKLSKKIYPKRFDEYNRILQSHSINTESFDGFFFLSSAQFGLENGKLIPEELINWPSNYYLQLSSMRLETQKLGSVAKK